MKVMACSEGRHNARYVLRRCLTALHVRFFYQLDFGARLEEYGTITKHQNLLVAVETPTTNSEQNHGLSQSSTSSKPSRRRQPWSGPRAPFQAEHHQAMPQPSF